MRISTKRSRAAAPNSQRVRPRRRSRWTSRTKSVRVNGNTRGSAAGKEVRQRPLGTDVMCLQLRQRLDGFHRRSDRHKAIEATRVVGAILVLGMAEHNASGNQRDLTMVLRTRAELA